MIAHVFPGQGSQYPGMGKELFENSTLAQELFIKANEILGFAITETMFNGTEDELKATRITQPAIFLHSVILARCMGDDFKPQMVAGHSLGEFSALVANGTLEFDDALRLVFARAQAMQSACEAKPSTMAAILGLGDEAVEKICSEVDGIVVPANYNCPGQLVISGEIEAIDKACELLANAGAKRALKLAVGGAFHSPLMEPARIELERAINETHFSRPLCAVYQNVNAQGVTDADEIKSNLVKQLTAPVRWTQIMNNMLAAGCTKVIEVGPGKVLQGLFKKVNRELETESAAMPTT